MFPLLVSTPDNLLLSPERFTANVHFILPRFHQSGEQIVTSVSIGKYTIRSGLFKRSPNPYDDYHDYHMDRLLISSKLSIE